MVDWLGPLAITAAVFAFGSSGIFVAVGIATIHKRRLRATRRSPLTADMLRGPGHSLRDQITEARTDIDGWMVALVAMPMTIAIVHISQSYYLGVPESVARVAISVVAVIAGIAYCTHRLLRDVRKRGRLLLGLDAETAVGQELNELVRQGAYVFHDVPGEHFNVDHVVVAANGVFAIETKGRSKHVDKPGPDGVRVVYDGKALQFPGWVETKPLEQAQRQAAWVSKWLGDATGDAVPCTAVLALPGWFIEHRVFEPVRVYNGKNPGFMLKLRLKSALDERTIKRIVHQLDQRCRTVAPSYLPKRP